MEDEVCVSKRNENDCVNIVRLICAVAVIAIHTKPFWGDNNQIYNFLQMLTRLAVPIFFTYTGYYVSTGGGRKILLAVKRLAISYTIWGFVYVIYLYFSGRNYVSTDQTLWFAYAYTKRFWFEGTSAHMWFVLAEIYWLMAIVVLLYFKRMSFIIPISLVFFTIGTLANGYYSLFPHITLIEKIHEGWIRQFLFLPFTYITLGYIIKKYVVKKLNNIKPLFLGLFLAVVLYLSELYIRSFLFDENDITFAFSQYLVVFIICTITVKTEMSIDRGEFLRKISSNIYFVHVLCIYLIQRVFMFFYGTVEINNSLLFVLCVCCSVGVAIVLEVIKSFGKK